jgi:fatty-acyl-CoA synthase
MDYPLTTTTILEYGNSSIVIKKIITYLPDGRRISFW